MNLQKLNVQEMKTEELMETSGGGLWSTYWDVILDGDNWQWAGAYWVGIL